MTLNIIYEHFKDDTDLLSYFDPQSKARNNFEASMEIYQKLVDFCSKENCVFRKNEIGYIFFYKKKWFQKKVLVSFCVKPECRSKENLVRFGEFIKKEIGKRFDCCLYNRNTRAINFLERLGLKKIKSNNLITLLSI